MSYYQRWAPYKPVAQRRAEAAKAAKKFAKGGQPLVPVIITGRAMATTFWGKAWGDNLERYSDFCNRLPRGRTYARNGSIIDLKIERGQISALVSGSSLYKITINIEPLNARRWKNLRSDCAKSIHSLLDLMRGRFSEEVMRRLTDSKTGVFPEPKEIKLSCSCPDSAYLCKHLAAVMYGIGHRLDSSPELFFELRGQDHRELIEDALNSNRLDEALAISTPAGLASEDLGAMFGIDLASGSKPEPTELPQTKAARTSKRTPASKSSKKTPLQAAPAESRLKRSQNVPSRTLAKSAAITAATRSASVSNVKAAVASMPKAKRKTGAKAR